MLPCRRTSRGFATEGPTQPVLLAYRLRGRTGVGRRATRGARKAVETFAPCVWAVMQETLERGEGAPIHVALELDDAFQRDPVIVPSPGVELGMLRGT